MHFQTQVGHLPELGQLDAAECHMGFARPFPPAAVVHRQKRLLKPCRDPEPFSPLGWRCGIEAKLVSPARVAQHQIDITQRNRRRTAQLVRPHQGAMPDDKLWLREHMAERRLVGLPGCGKIQPGNEDLAVSQTTHIEHRVIHIQLVETQRQQGLWRKRYQHAGQAQRLAALRVCQRDVRHLERRDHAGRVGRDRFDAHRHPQHMACGALQQRAKLANSRHNEQMQCSPRHRQQQPCDQ